MMRFLLSLLLLGSLALPAQAANKANSVALRPGDVVYARFEANGKKLRLISTSKEKDEAAQVIFTLTRDKDTLEVKLKVENKFPHDLDYVALMHSRRLDSDAPGAVSPVVGGKLAFETFPALTDDVTLSGFKLEL